MTRGKGWLPLLIGQYGNNAIRVLRDLGVTLGSQVTARVLGVLSFVVVVKSVSVYDYGQVAIVQSVITFGAGVLLQGVTWAMIRGVSSGAHGQLEDESRFVVSMFVLHLVVSALVLGLLILFPRLFEVAFNLPTEGRATFEVVLVGIPAQILMNFAVALLQARHQFFSAALVSTCQPALVLGIYLLVAEQGHLSIDVVLWTMAIAPLAVSVAASMMTSRNWIRGRVDWSSVYSAIMESRWFVLYTLFLVVSNQLDVFAMAHFASIEEVGVYAVAARIYGVIMMSLTAVHAVLLPKLSGIHDRSRLRQVIKRSFWLTMPLGALLVVAVALSADPLVLALSTDDYAGAVTPLRILLVGAFLGIVLSPLANVLFALRDEKFVALTGVALLLLQFAGHYLLTSAIGAEGAAITVVMSFGAVNTVVALRAWRLTSSASRID